MRFTCRYGNLTVNKHVQVCRWVRETERESERERERVRGRERETEEERLIELRKTHALSNVPTQKQLTSGFANQA